MDRRRFYGTGAALLADRHERKAAPLVMRIPTAVAVIALLTRTWLGWVVALVCAGYSAWTVRRRLDGLPRRDHVSATLTASAFGHGLLQVGGAVCRNYWPIALLGALLSRRLRVLFLQVAIADALVAWIGSAQANRRVPAIDPVSFFVLRRLDDLDTVRVLLDAGVAVDHVNNLGWTALLEAVILGDGGPTHTAIVRLLIRHRANLDLADRDAVTALAHAERRGFREMAELLRAAGARAAP